MIKAIINLDEKYRIVIEEINIVLEKNKGTKTSNFVRGNVGTVTSKWTTQGFYHTIQNALIAYANNTYKDATSIKNLIKRIKKVENKIKELEFDLSSLR